MKREFSAGGAVYCQTKRGIEWLLIRPKGTDRWQLPKGMLNPDETSAEAALREVGEEGGIEAKLCQKIDTVRIFYYWPPKDQVKAGEKQEQIAKTITFYLMKVVGKRSNGPDKNEVDEAAWLDFSEALSRLTFKNEKEIFKKAKELVE